jgi:hypothetical protein
VNQFDDIELSGPLHLAKESDLMSLVDYLEKIRWLDKERKIQEAIEQCLRHMVPHYLAQMPNMQPVTTITGTTPFATATFNEIKVTLPRWVPEAYRRPIVEQMIREQIK